MNTLAVFALLVAATYVVGEEASQYVDDALIQKVGQIVHDYDQRAAASRTSESYLPPSTATKTGTTDLSGEYPSSSWDRYQSDRYGRLNYDVDGRYTTDLERRSAYDVALQQRLGYNPDLRSSLYPQSRYSSYNPQQKLAYTPSTQYRTERQYSDIYRPSYMQSQYNSGIYDVNRNQRQFGLPLEPASSLPATRTIPSSYQYQPSPAPYKYQPSPASYKYQPSSSVQRPVVRALSEQQPQTKTGGFSGYSLSQPESVPKIAEFHESAARQAKSQVRDTFDTASIQAHHSGVQKQGGYRLA